MMLIVLPVLGSVFSGDGLGGVPGCFALAYLLTVDCTRMCFPMTRAVVVFVRDPRVPSVGTSGREWSHQSLWENQTIERSGVGNRSMYQTGKLKTRMAVVSRIQREVVCGIRMAEIEAGRYAHPQRTPAKRSQSVLVSL